METDAKRIMNDAFRRTLVVLGVGLVASLAVGLLYGVVIDDVARGVGTVVALGMSLAAVAGVAVNLWRR
jgi:hypothetical protein